MPIFILWIPRRQNVGINCSQVDGFKDRALLALGLYVYVSCWTTGGFQNMGNICIFYVFMTSWQVWGMWQGRQMEDNQSCNPVSQKNVSNFFGNFICQHSDYYYSHLFSWSFQHNTIQWIATYSIHCTITCTRHIEHVTYLKYSIHGLLIIDWSRKQCLHQRVTDS